MASPRKSAVQVKARELARERAAAHLRRQDTLLDLAETFYAKQAERDSLAEKEAARIEAVRAEFAAVAAGVEQSMAGAVAAMVATGEPVAGVAERLGIKPKDVRAFTDAAAPSVTETAETDTDEQETVEEEDELTGSFGEQEYGPVSGTGDGDQEQSAA